MHPLCLTIDPGKTSAIALGEPAERPRLLGVWVVLGNLAADAWAERAFECFSAAARLSVRRKVVCRYELTIGSRSGAVGQATLHMRRGQLLGHASDAGAVRLGDVAYFMVQTWTSILGVPGKKLGEGAAEGQHRIEEALRLVECAEDTFRGLGPGAVDAAEAVLMMAALSRVVRGEVAAKKPRARKARKAA